MSTITEAGAHDRPLHWLNSGLGELGPSGPQGPADYLTWVLSDEQRLASASRHLGHLDIGLHFLVVDQIFNQVGEVVDKTEIHFWSEDFPPDEAQGTGGHAHSRRLELWSFIGPDALQHVTGVMLLPPDTGEVSGLETKEGILAILNKVDDGLGIGTQYHPMVIGNRRFTQFHADLPPFSHQKFESTFVHDVHYSAPDKSVGLTIQRQWPAEDPYLQTLEGLALKGLAHEEARRVLAEVTSMRTKLDQTARYVGSTVLIRPPEFDPTAMQDRATRPPESRFEELALGSLRSLKRLGAHLQIPKRYISTGKWAEASPNPKVGEVVAFEDLSAEVQADLLAARNLINNQLIAHKSTKIGCVIAGRDQRFNGINIKRDFGIQFTHAEELAVSEALVAGAPIDRVTLYSEMDGQGMPAMPCGNCREIIAHGLRKSGQTDVTIYSMGEQKNGVTRVQLSSLLPLSDSLLRTND